MRLQLWSYNFHPEPSGIAPLSTVWAHGMRERGHEVTVVAAHPHYPTPLWGQRTRPYRERHDGIEVLRLPLWAGRGTNLARLRQEATFMAALTATAPLLPAADAIVGVTPSFPALAPLIAHASVRRTPWVMWLQDILPDGAATTGTLNSGLMLDAARRFERAAYRSAEKIVVISGAFERNLLAKGVDPAKLVRIFNPSAVPIGHYIPPQPPPDAPRLLVMGNIGRTQGLPAVVSAIQATEVLSELNAELRIAGDGVDASRLRDTIADDRIKMLGVLLGHDMEDELGRTTLGMVTQVEGVAEFNLPSKLMNYMAHGLPVLAIVNPDAESARIVRDANAGWVLDSGKLDALPGLLREILADPAELRRRGQAAHRFAREHFAPDRIVEQFEGVLASAVGATRPPVAA